jgi:hypothetical protein
MLAPRLSFSRSSHLGAERAPQRLPTMSAAPRAASRGLASAHGNGGGKDRVPLEQQKMAGSLPRPSFSTGHRASAGAAVPQEGLSS